MNTPAALTATGFREHDARIRYFVKGEPRQNFGDYLPELLAKTFFLHPRVDADVYRVIGSVIEPEWIRRDLRRNVGIERGCVAFWGCGKRDDKPLDPHTRSLCRFFGTRGPLTRDALGLAHDTVLGDPGLLAPLMHHPTPAPDVEGRTVCIPHVQDQRSDAELLALSGADLVLRPLVRASEADLRRMLDRIASAQFVLSASLHGAIVACAYERRFAFWDNGHLDVEFKWRDFAASIGV
ncbi:MAG TPA: polysaccharide pyruvyl transferase family protein, partial [Burkholderiaceae bacterium]|nr:polysaccharide pyruvyl transferase family protein [Burkholderiaceae bacterium]